MTWERWWDFWAGLALGWLAVGTAVELLVLRSKRRPGEVDTFSRWVQQYVLIHPAVRWSTLGAWLAFSAWLAEHIWL